MVSAGVQQRIQQLWLTPLMEDLRKNKIMMVQHILDVLQWAAKMEYYLSVDHYYEYECRNWSVWRQPFLSKDMVSILLWLKHVSAGQNNNKYT